MQVANVHFFGKSFKNVSGCKRVMMLEIRIMGPFCLLRVDLCLSPLLNYWSVILIWKQIKWMPSLNNQLVGDTSTSKTCQWHHKTGKNKRSNSYRLSKLLQLICFCEPNKVSWIWWFFRVFAFEFKSLQKFESFYSSIGLFFPATYLIRVSKLCICMLKNSKSLIQYIGHINQIGLKGNW